VRRVGGVEKAIAVEGKVQTTSRVVKRKIMTPCPHFLLTGGKNKPVIIILKRMGHGG